MPAILYALIGIFLYATQNVLLDQKLRAFSAPALLLLFQAATAPLAVVALLRMKAAGEPILWPGAGSLLYVAAGGITYFMADYCYVSAYTRADANVFAVTVCAALMPVFVIVLTAPFGARPNAYQVAGMVFAAIAVGFVAWGGATRQVEAPP